MKNTLRAFLILLLLPCFTEKSAAQSRQDTFYPKKYNRMIEIDMKGLFSYFGPGGGFIFRKKHESGNFVFVDRTRYWRMGFYISGAGFQRKVDSTGVGWYNNQSPPNFSFYPTFGHETMFHFKRFNLFYAYDLGLGYNYLDDFQERSNKLSLSISASLGMRYFISERFSLSLQSTPLAISVFRRFGKLRNQYTQLPIYDSRGNLFYLNVTTSEPLTFKENGYNIGQSWFSSLGFTYHF